MIPPLSAELLYDILDHLFPVSPAHYSPSPSPSYAEIKNCCLVSRQWAAYLQRRLFRHVELGTPQDRLCFLRAISRRGGDGGRRAELLSQSIRTLVLKGPIFRKDEGRDFSDLFAVCPNLCTVHVRGEMTLSYVPRSDHLNHFVRFFPSIERLDVEQRPSSSWDALYGLLGMLPSLNHLAIRDYSCPGTLPPLPDPFVASEFPFPFSLREFLLVCPWKRAPADYFSTFLASSVGTLEVLSISIVSDTPPVDFETVVTTHRRTLRSLGIDVSDTVPLSGDLIGSCERLQQLVLTGFQSDLCPLLPVTVRRLQFNSPVWPDLSGQSTVDDTFLRAFAEALPRLPLLAGILLPGYHARDPRVGKKYAGDVAISSPAHWEEKCAGLRKECEKYGVVLESPFHSENDRWMRFYDFYYPQPTVEDDL